VRIGGRTIVARVTSRAHDCHAGWLGGEMVFRSHLAMIADDPEGVQREEARHRFRPASQRR